MITKDLPASSLTDCKIANAGSIWYWRNLKVENPWVQISRYPAENLFFAIEATIHDLPRWSVLQIVNRELTNPIPL